MKNRLMPLIDKILLRKRSLIETVNEPIKKYLSDSTYSPPQRSNFLVNVIAGLIAYTYQDKKPSLNLTIEDLDSIQEAHFFPNEPLAFTII